MRWGPSISRTVQRARYLIVNRVRTGRYVLARWIKPSEWAPGDPFTPWSDPWLVSDRLIPWTDEDRAERHKVAANRYRTPPSPCTDPWCSPGDGCILAADHPPQSPITPRSPITDHFDIRLPSADDKRGAVTNAPHYPWVGCRCGCGGNPAPTPHPGADHATPSKDQC